MPMSTSPTHRRVFFFYLIDGFCLRTLSSAITALKLANKVRGEKIYEWRLIGQSPDPVPSSCWVDVSVDMALGDERAGCEHTRNSVVVICGGSDIPFESRALDAWVRKCHHHGAAIVSLSGGSFVIARSGLFHDARWSIHWEHFPIFNERFPYLDARQTLFEVDRGFYSSAGGDAAFDAFSVLVQNDLGLEIADRICEIALKSGVPRPGERQRLPLKSRYGELHPAIVKIVDRMSANLEHPLKLNEFTRTSGLSRRQIERLFREQLGRTPSKFYNELRLERADLLLQKSPLPIIDVAIACGFVSGSHFTKSYRKQFERTPREQRAASRTSQDSGQITRLAAAE